MEHRLFYIVNATLVKGSRYIAEALAARRDVARGEGNPQIKNILPQSDVITEALSPGQRPQTIEPGINYTHAQMCGRWGVQGTGNDGGRY